MIALIDGDPLLYVAAHHNREEEDIQKCYDTLDNLVNTILLQAGCTGYYGALGVGKCFRHREYLYAPYKGKRPEKTPEEIHRKQQMTSYLKTRWGFFWEEDLEADDVICYLAEDFRLKGTEHIICSPDKDLRQVPGNHYDFRKDEKSVISPETADYNFWLQMLMGDSTDGIAGIPGLGSVKAKTLLDKTDDPFLYQVTVMEQYIKAFGQYYGPVIYKETKMAIQLLCSDHPYLIGGMSFITGLKFSVIIEHNIKYYEPQIVPAKLDDVLDNLFGD